MFHKTINVSYPMIYDASTEQEYTELYELLPVLNEQAAKIKAANEMIKLFQDAYPRPNTQVMYAVNKYLNRFYADELEKPLPEDASYLEGKK